MLPGASGCHIEDQEFPKRCGHLEGKRLISSQEFQEKIAAARDSSLQHTQGEFIVCARTDARGVEGFDSACERGIAAVSAGADMLFPEGLRSEQEFRQFAERIRKGSPQSEHNTLLCANMTEFGVTPHIPLSRFAEMGYHVVIFPVTTLRAAMKGVEEALAEIAAKGEVTDVLHRMQTRKELYQTLQYDAKVPWTYPSPTIPPQLTRGDDER